MNSDHADETVLSASNPLGEIVALAIDPADSHTLTAAAVKDSAAALYVSKDGGGDWKKATALAETPQAKNLDRPSFPCERPRSLHRRQKERHGAAAGQVAEPASSARR